MCVCAGICVCVCVRVFVCVRLCMRAGMWVLRVFVYVCACGYICTHVFVSRCFVCALNPFEDILSVSATQFVVFSSPLKGQSPPSNT